MRACVEMTAVCLIGRIASTWSSRWRVPLGAASEAVVITFLDIKSPSERRTA